MAHVEKDMKVMGYYDSFIISKECHNETINPIFPPLYKEAQNGDVLNHISGLPRDKETLQLGNIGFSYT